ncbi:Probable RNA-directed DNA polymerase from transposon BS [Eumeta japonica]|uniref:Probable RNA-directed DNA polymerase from transposon BS n=1 Tax=Eumeta variegata TaxID=151549 RepID=A0A4C1ZLH5_EUMVA|nr:Probable RNA-directed DNA polymerase from transposon BS [Eumeta japonica]
MEPRPVASSPQPSGGAPPLSRESPERLRTGRHAVYRPLKHLKVGISKLRIRTRSTINKMAIHLQAMRMDVRRPLSFGDSSLRYRYKNRLVFIIHQYLTNRLFSFRHENSTSAKRLNRAGVPQGSIFYPMLYSAYTNDIPRPQTGVQLALFADDTALYLRSSNFRQITLRLQKAIDELTRWFQT